MMEQAESIRLTHDEIADIMPHQEPFLFLDEADIGLGNARGSYKITGEEYFLKGHFKEEPVFPASIMIEAVGQLAVLFLLTSKGLELPHPVDNKKIMFTACEDSSCHQICRPGDVLEFSVAVKKVRAPFIKFQDCMVSKEGKKVFKTGGISLAFALKQ